eukprot:1158202-Pelagomonas_calceolata.AAC.4
MTIYHTLKANYFTTHLEGELPPPYTHGRQCAWAVHRMQGIQPAYELQALKAWQARQGLKEIRWTGCTRMQCKRLVACEMDRVLIDTRSMDVLSSSNQTRQHLNCHSLAKGRWPQAQGTPVGKVCAFVHSKATQELRLNKLNANCME